MDCWFKYSIENKLPIELIYMNELGELTQRIAIVRKITVKSILTFDMGKRQMRSFKRANILSATKQGRKRGVKYE